MTLNLIKRFHKSEIIVQKHIVDDFPVFYLLLNQVRFLHLLAFIIVLLSKSQHSIVIYGYMQLLHGIFIILLSLVNFYIILYCNTITTEMAMQGAKIATQAAVGSFITHNAMSIYFIPPNAVSNAYHIYSPTGRGYGAYSCSQLIAVDALKGAQGPRFDPSTIVNDQNMLDNAKIAKQFKQESNLPKLSEFLGKKF